MKIRTFQTSQEFYLLALQRASESRQSVDQFLSQFFFTTYDCICGTDDKILVIVNDAKHNPCLTLYLTRSDMESI